MATKFWSPAQVILGPFVFSFQFLVLVSIEFDKMDYISYLMKLFKKFEAKKINFDGVLTKSENPRWPP